MKKLTLGCPVCGKVLYRNLEETEKFVVAGRCVYCKSLLIFNPKKSVYVYEKDE